jgi:hypothetical protein
MLAPGSAHLRAVLRFTAAGALTMSLTGRANGSPLLGVVVTGGLSRRSMRWPTGCSGRGIG